MPDITTMDANEYITETAVVRLLREVYGLGEAQARKFVDSQTGVSMPTLFTKPGVPLRYWVRADILTWLGTISPLG